MGRKRARTDSGSAPDEMGRELTCLESGPRPTCTGTLARKQRRSHSESFGQVVRSRVLGTGVGEEAYTAAVTGPLAAVISSASERSRTMQRTAPLTMDGSCRARGGEASIPASAAEHHAVAQEKRGVLRHLHSKHGGLTDQQAEVRAHLKTLKAVGKVARAEAREIAHINSEAIETAREEIRVLREFVRAKEKEGAEAVASIQPFV
jgi:hypothetical protein